MTTISTQPSGLLKVMYWTPRVLSILAIGFISIFALDAFSHGQTWLQQLGAFLLHLIPSFVLLAILAYAWRHEKWGGIVFMLIGIILTPIVFNKNYQMNNSVWMSLGIILLITFPFVLVGILFLVHHIISIRPGKNSSH